MLSGNRPQIEENLKAKRMTSGLIAVLTLAGLMSTGSLCDLIAIGNHNVTFRAMAKVWLHDKKHDQWLPGTGIRVYYHATRVENGVRNDRSTQGYAVNSDLLGESDYFFKYYLNRKTTEDRGYIDGADVTASAEYLTKTATDSTRDVPLSWVTESDTENVPLSIWLDTL